MIEPANEYFKTPTTYEHPTMRLRFVMRDGKRILQQEWQSYKKDEMQFAWVDVPLDETAVTE